MQRLFTNNANTTLAAPITSTAISLSVTSGGGALFPAVGGGTSFTATLQHIVANVVTAFEIVLVTGRSTDNFTQIVRAQEGTTALSWNAGDTVALLPTANDLAQMAQFDDLQKQAGNFALDVGSANAYSVTLTPALTAHVQGMPIRWSAGHTNTGASTFSDGVGAGALVISPGVPLPAGTVLAGGLYESTWDGSEFQLGYSANLAPYATLAALAAFVTQVNLSSQLTGYLTLSSAVATYMAKTGGTFTGAVFGLTPPTATNNTQLATTAFVQNLNNQQIIKTGSFTCINGTVSVTFPVQFPNACAAVHVQWEYTDPDTGFVVPGTRTDAGFQYLNGNSGFCTYIAVGS